MLSDLLTPLFATAAALLVVAGIAKLRVPEAAPLQGAHGAGAARGRLLGALELTLGLTALVAPRPAVAFCVAVAYAGFCGFVLQRLVSGRGGEPCGCFGAEANAPASALHAAVTFVCALVAALATAAGAHGLGWLTHLSPASALALAGGTAAATYATYAALTEVPAAWRAYRHAGARQL